MKATWPVSKYVATTLTLQEDLPKGSTVEAWVTLDMLSPPEVELVPRAPSHIGVTEDKGAELELVVPDHQHIQDGDVLVIAFDHMPTLKEKAVAEANLRDLCKITRAAAGIVMLPGQRFGAMSTEAVTRVFAD